MPKDNFEYNIHSVATWVSTLETSPETPQPPSVSPSRLDGGPLPPHPSHLFHLAHTISATEWLINKTRIDTLYRKVEQKEIPMEYYKSQMSTWVLIRPFPLQQKIPIVKELIVPYKNRTFFLIYYNANSEINDIEKVTQIRFAIAHALAHALFTFVSPANNNRCHQFYSAERITSPENNPLYCIEEAEANIFALFLLNKKKQHADTYKKYFDVKDEHLREIIAQSTNHHIVEMMKKIVFGGSNTTYNSFFGKYL